MVKQRQRLQAGTVAEAEWQTRGGHGGPPASGFLRAVDQVGNSVPDRSGYEQCC